MTRSTILEALFDDYVRTARSKGLREQAVVSRHVMRNALLPVVTTSGATMGALIGGAVATETAFGMVWTRPGLDLKTRTLVCVVSDAATGREPELAIHLRMALRQGWTQEELTEVLLHLSAYVGLPMVREALLAAKKVFAEVTTG